MSLGAALLVAAAISGSLDVSDRSELRLRDSGELAGQVVDLETAPTATLSLRSRTFRFAIAYLPRFTLRQADYLPAPEIFHRGALSATLRGPRHELALDADLAYGTTSFTSLVPIESADPAHPQVDRLPQLSTIDYVSSRAGVTATFTPTHRWTFRLQAEHALSGGADSASRARVPFQSGPHAAFSASHALSRRDSVISAIDASRVLFSSGPDNVLAEAVERWRHAFSRGGALTLGGGASLVVARTTAEGAWSARPYALGEVAISYRAPAPLVETMLAARIAPVVDRLSGLVDERLQGSALLSWTASPGLVLRTQFGAAQSVQWGRAGAVRIVVGEAAFAVRAGRTAQVELGTRVAVQEGYEVGASPAQWMIFTGASFSLPKLRF
jgi:hypothetical protein